MGASQVEEEFSSFFCHTFGKYFRRNLVIHDLLNLNKNHQIRKEILRNIFRKNFVQLHDITIQTPMYKSHKIILKLTKVLYLLNEHCI